MTTITTLSLCVYNRDNNKRAVRKRLKSVVQILLSKLLTDEGGSGMQPQGGIDRCGCSEEL